MNTQTRRQREYLEREQRFIDCARSIIRQDGVSALTMDRIAELTEYAKGTVYKHFSCKEDILCGLCLDSLNHLQELFYRAQQFQGNNRERIICFALAYQLYTAKFPEEFDLLIASRTNNVREKASAERLQQMDQVDTLVLGHMRSIIEQAISAGDLRLAHKMKLDDLCFGLWSISFGLLALDHARDMVKNLDLTHGDQSILNQITCLLDGYGWHPLSTEFDFSSTHGAAFDYLQNYISKD